MRYDEFLRLANKDVKSDDEIKLLEPYKVRRAVLFAAGIGKRMRPITYCIPKPLIKVKGRMLIETAIDALLQNSINEIYIVRGYLAEKFDVLLEKYPQIKFIENPYYAEGNNITSAKVASHLLSGAYVMAADLYIADSKIVPLYQYNSNALGIPIEETADWCFKVKEGVIYEQSRIGGRNGYLDIGIFYWDKKDGARLQKQLDVVFNSKTGKENFWGCIPFEIYKEDYQVNLRTCGSNCIYELDTIEELIELDDSYSKILGENYD